MSHNVVIDASDILGREGSAYSAMRDREYLHPVYKRLDAMRENTESRQIARRCRNWTMFGVSWCMYSVVAYATDMIVVETAETAETAGVLVELVVTSKVVACRGECSGSSDKSRRHHLKARITESTSNCY